jgi:hypothetical protein
LPADQEAPLEAEPENGAGDSDTSNGGNGEHA